jgi:hypothetical protein
VRPSQSRPSLPRLAARAIWILRGHKIPLQPPPEEPEEPEEPARFLSSAPTATTHSPPKTKFLGALTDHQVVVHFQCVAALEPHRYA